MPKENQIVLPVDYVILDTETTGLDNNAEIIEISIIDMNGNILLDTLVKPSEPMPDWCEAVHIHGINNEMLADEPTWKEIYSRVFEILSGKNVVIYNAEYDLRLIRQTCSKYTLKAPIETAFCAMKYFSEWYGEESYRFPGEYHRQSLYKAVQFTGNRFDGVQHRSLTDCKAVLAVLKSMELAKSPQEMEEILKQRFQHNLKIVMEDNPVVLSVNAGGNIKGKRIVEISITDIDGNILLDTYIGRKRKINANAKFLSALGKSADDFLGYPKWNDIYNDVWCLLNGKTVFTLNGYNKCLELLNSESLLYGLPVMQFNELSVGAVLNKSSLYSIDYAAEKLGIRIDNMKSLSGCQAAVRALGYVKVNG